MPQSANNSPAINFSGLIQKIDSKANHRPRRAGSLRRIVITAVAWLGQSFLTAVASAHCLPLLGVNLAGAEFNPQVLPGKRGTNFTYPANAELDYYAGQGMTVICLPVLWNGCNRLNTHR